MPHSSKPADTQAVCLPLFLGMVRGFYRVGWFLMYGVGCVKKDSEAVRRLADVLCAAWCVFVLSNPSSLGFESSGQVSQVWAVASVGTGRRQ